MHFAVPHYADWNIIPSIQKIKVMRVNVNYSRPRVYFWNDPVNAERLIDPKSFHPISLEPLWTLLVSANKWFPPNSNFEFRG